VLLKVIAATGALAAASLLLTGCFGSAQPSEPACPDLTAAHFGLDPESTVVDPHELADSEGLDDLLDGTCAYGFETEEIAAVAFHIANPSPDAADAFFATAESTAVSLGYFLDHTRLDLEPSMFGGFNDDDVRFFISYYEEFDRGDGISEGQFDDMGLVEGDSLITGGIGIKR
jgi:hypothetical protein